MANPDRAPGVGATPQEIESALLKALNTSLTPESELEVALADLNHDQATMEALREVMSAKDPVIIYNAQKE